ncbi:MAG: hypothetical protein HNEKOMLI_00057 [Sodalis sp. Psp]|nr:hypothetical protein [Sodalis sp. Psp]MCR3756564.1 hypothetical protein [Sodalis sp. Ppy]
MTWFILIGKYKQDTIVSFVLQLLGPLPITVHQQNTSKLKSHY